MTEFNLSDKIYKQAPGTERLPDSISTSDVREFIKALKNELYLTWKDAEIFNKLAGEKLNA